MTNGLKGRGVQRELRRKSFLQWAVVLLVIGVAAILSAVSGGPVGDYWSLGSYSYLDLAVGVPLVAAGVVLLCLAMRIPRASGPPLPG